jgi:hypothetical protein
MRRIGFWVFAMICLVPSATVADNEFERESLKGLQGVGVLIENLNADAERAGLDSSTLTTDVELRLRQAGIVVLSRAERVRAPGSPYLYVNVAVIKSPSAQDGVCRSGGILPASNPREGPSGHDKCRYLGC